MRGRGGSVGSGGGRVAGPGLRRRVVGAGGAARGDAALRTGVRGLAGVAALRAMDLVVGGGGLAAGARARDVPHPAILRLRALDMGRALLPAGSRVDRVARPLAVPRCQVLSWVEVRDVPSGRCASPCVRRARSSPRPSARAPGAHARPPRESRAGEPRERRTLGWRIEAAHRISPQPPRKRGRAPSNPRAPKRLRSLGASRFLDTLNPQGVERTQPTRGPHALSGLSGSDSRRRGFCAQCGAGLRPGCERCGAALRRRIDSAARAVNPSPLPRLRPGPIASDRGSRAPSDHGVVLRSGRIHRARVELDPEDWRDVVRQFQKMCIDVIQQFEGHVAQYLGDGLLVYSAIPAPTRTTPNGRSGRRSAR